ncbi:MAG: class GN sortase [Parahaliea sp.]
MLLPLFERIRPFALLLLLIIAVQQLGASALIYAKAALAPILMERAWHASLANGGQAHKPWPWADTWPVARLHVPELGIDQFVLAGASGNVLAFGPGLDEAGAIPGDEGTVVIGGHRDTHFRFLQQLQPAMLMRLDLPDGRSLNYRVDYTQVLDTRQPVLAPALTGPSKLELVTCYPFNAMRAGGPLRYIVYARPQSPLKSQQQLAGASFYGFQPAYREMQL